MALREEEIQRGEAMEPGGEAFFRSAARRFSPRGLFASFQVARGALIASFSPEIARLILSRLS